MSVVNEDRGELAIELDGERFGLRPSYEALAEIESELGVGLMALTREALGGTLTMAQMGQVVAILIRAWGRSQNNVNAGGAKTDKITRMIMDSPGGMSTAMTVIGTALTLAVTGGLSPEGEVKAATSEPATGA